MQRTVVVMGALVALTALPCSARGDEAPGADEARQHFRAGVTLLQDPDGARYEEAYREFKTAYGLVPSPKILGNLAYCALKLERDQEAIEAYEQYLREAQDVEESERKQVEADLLTLRTGLVRVELSVEGPAAMVVDRRIPTRGEPIVNTYGPVPASGRLTLGVRQGRHVIEVKIGEGAPQTWQIDAMPGGKLEHVFRPPPPEPPAPAPSRAVPITLTALGGAMLAGGAVTGILALTRTKKIESACPNGVCPVGYGVEDQRSTTYTLARATDVLLIGGGVLAATGVTWLLLARRPSGPVASAACTGDGCGAMIQGRF